MFAKALSTRTLGVISLLSGAAFFILLTLPYYYFPQSYIPKANPVYGYYMPKSAEAWVALVVALCFLALSIGAFALIIKKQTKGREGR